MPRRSTSRLCSVLLAVLAAGGLSVTGSGIAAADTSPAGTQISAQSMASAATTTAGFRGVNWADPRDNFADDAVILSGLSRSDSYATVKAKASAIITGFQNNDGANTVRLPINPYSVGTAWWNSYIGAIDAATTKGFKVVLSYWEGNNARDGKIDNTTSWNAMWDTVIAKYGGNSLVYFEPMNEPYGYSDTEWKNVAAGWLSRYSTVPRNRVFVSGAGYNQRLATVGSDTRFDGTYISMHTYQFFDTSRHTEASWYSQVTDTVGSYASRVVIDEWGAPMTDGRNYDVVSSSDDFVSYIRGVSAAQRALGLGSVYWPGLRNADHYSLETLNGSGTDLTLTTNNASGIRRLRYGWGDTVSATASPLRGTASGRCLDVINGASTDGTSVGIYDCNRGPNQQWAYTSSQQLQVYGNKCLDAYQGGRTNGTVVDIYTCNGGANQRWILNSDGTIRGVASGLCLDVTSAATANGTRVKLYTCSGDGNQKWTKI